MNCGPGGAFMWPPPSIAEPETRPEDARKPASVTRTDSISSFSLHSSVLSSLNAEWKEKKLVREEDHIIQTIWLEEFFPRRERFLCLLSRGGSHRKLSSELSSPARTLTAAPRNSQYFLMGIDRYATNSAEEEEEEEEDMTSCIGLLIPLMWDVQITLDGDGGFSLRQLGRHFIFKPKTVQALWTIIQTLHVVCQRLRPPLKFVNNAWLENSYAVNSPQSCINDWNYMADILVRRPTSPERISDERSTEVVIKNRLRVIMKGADLDSITSKGIRKQLEEELDQSLEMLKPFIDKEILLILGQMDPASQILDYLYLGSEWNASNLDELRQHGITHILNVTREIDNFYPGMFTYKNVREYDEESTDLLKYLDGTYRFIKSAKEEGGRVLVHCKMGISRSATVTTAFVMKENSIRLREALDLVKQRRSIVSPNKSFLKQLEVYEGILSAFSHRHTYFGLKRSKSESSLTKTEKRKNSKNQKLSIPFQINIKALSVKFDGDCRTNSEPLGLSRPKSWSPNQQTSEILIPKGANNNSRGRDCDCFGSLNAQDCGNQNHREETSGDNQLSRSLNTNETFAEARNLLIFGPINASNLRYNQNCECDMEMLLPVPDCPVDIHKYDDSEAIVQSLSNIPLQIRSLESTSTTTTTTSRYQKTISLPVVIGGSKRCDNLVDTPNTESVGCNMDQHQKHKKTEELSVRTLASMFDYKLKSTSVKSKCYTTLDDCQVFQRAKQKAGRSSEC